LDEFTVKEAPAGQLADEKRHGLLDTVVASQASFWVPKDLQTRMLANTLRDEACLAASVSPTRTTEYAAGGGPDGAPGSKVRIGTIGIHQTIFSASLCSARAFKASDRIFV